MTSFRLSDLCSRVSGSLRGPGDVEIHGLAGLFDAGPGDLTFVASAQYGKALASTKASAVMIPTDFPEIPLPAIAVAQPDRVFESLVEIFRPRVVRPAVGIDRAASIAPSAEIAPDCAIGANAYIGEGAKLRKGVIVHPGAYVGADAEIGEGTEIHPNVVIGARVRVGARVILNPSVVLGGEGFGFRPGPRGLEKLEHIGTVVVEDDVEIGAGTTVDRARFGRTRIGRGTKIDNLCQIAHNVQIGAFCVIAAQTGLSGSTVVGNGCMLGGQVGTVPQVRIGDGAKIAARSGISKDTAPKAVVYGFVAGPHLERKREEAAVRQLPALLKRVRELERRLGIDEPASSGDS